MMRRILVRIFLNMKMYSIKHLTGGDKPRPYGEGPKSNVGEDFMSSRVTLGICICIYEIVYLVLVYFYIMK